MDYAETEDVLFKQFPCFCGSPNCRLWITGRKEMINLSTMNAPTETSRFMNIAQIIGED
jgi:hypothetical protein